MPYIKDEDRPKILNKIKSLSMDIENEGELNYAISKLIDLLIQKWGEKYSNYNKIAGVISCVDKEVYRKLVAVYEDEKERENGTIWRTNKSEKDNYVRIDPNMKSDI